MNQPQIKLPKLPNTKPMKQTVSVMPDQEADLEAQAKVYEKAYGEKVDVSALIPSMLASFLAGDAGFKKAKRELAQLPPRQAQEKTLWLLLEHSNRLRRDLRA